jgi:hypothetical protein
MKCGGSRNAVAGLVKQVSKGGFAVIIDAESFGVGRVVRAWL